MPNAEDLQRDHQGADSPNASVQGFFIEIQA